MRSRERTALLVVDVQQGLFKRSTPVYNADELLEVISALVERAHRADAPVFYIQHANKSWLAKGSDDWRLHPRLRPLDVDGVIHKRHGSAFQDTSLGEELASRSVERLVVTGLVTRGCVRATCLDALKQGYEVVLARDGHSTFSKGAAKLIEQWNVKLAEAGVQVLPAQEIAYH